MAHCTQFRTFCYPVETACGGVRHRTKNCPNNTTSYGMPLIAAPWQGKVKRIRTWQDYTVHQPLFRTVHATKKDGQAGEPENTRVGDKSLFRVLELASDEELLELSEILYGQSLLSPLVKSLTAGDGTKDECIEDCVYEGAVEGHYEARQRLVERLVARFLFLGADSREVLRGERPSYHTILLSVRDKLRVRCSKKLATEDLEAEIFLHLLEPHGDDSRSTDSEIEFRNQVMARNSSEKRMNGRLKGALVAALKMGKEELLTTVFKGGSAITISTLQKLIAEKLTGNVILERARYQVAKEIMKKGGQAVATKLESHLALLTARQSLAGAAARYVGLRSTMMLVGPLMWGTFLADMVIRAVGTDYARVVRAVFAIAQIRLSRTYGWRQSEENEY